MKQTARALLLVVVACASAQTKDPAIYRVDDHVYRGRQPANDEFAALRKMGIRTVLDLRGGSIHAPRERALVEAVGMQYVSIGLSGVFAPTQQQMARILALLEDPARAPVFVHCRRGADRSGLVIACYRIAHDHWTNAQALAEANEQGFSHLEVLMRRYVRRYTPPPAASGAVDAPASGGPETKKAAGSRPGGLY
ncbi:MAG TPA: tyrosine-protein phosphatase [Bryobacteraceae bacterium]|nr:tyrosine-protein phosphatase [Bryobacteraceae bacterium]